MRIPSGRSGHWTDDELVAFHYGVGPYGKHIDECAECQSRLAAMQASRERIENTASISEGVSTSFLASQRRFVYQRLEQPIRWWNALPVRRWAAGLATACVLGGSLAVYQHSREAQLAQERISDAKLVQEVTMMAADTGTSSMAPLEGLFE